MEITENSNTIYNLSVGYKIGRKEALRIWLSLCESFHFTELLLVWIVLILTFSSIFANSTSLINTPKNFFIGSVQGISNSFSYNFISLTEPDIKYGPISLLQGFLSLCSLLVKLDTSRPWSFYKKGFVPSHLQNSKLLSPIWSNNKFSIPLLYLSEAPVVVTKHHCLCPLCKSQFPLLEELFLL